VGPKAGLKILEDTKSLIPLAGFKHRIVWSVA